MLISGSTTRCQRESNMILDSQPSVPLQCPTSIFQLTDLQLFFDTPIDNKINYVKEFSNNVQISNDGQSEKECRFDRRQSYQVDSQFATEECSSMIANFSITSNNLGSAIDELYRNENAEYEDQLSSREPLLMFHQDKHEELTSVVDGAWFSPNITAHHLKSDLAVTGLNTTNEVANINTDRSHETTNLSIGQTKPTKSPNSRLYERFDVSTNLIELHERGLEPFVDDETFSQYNSQTDSHLCDNKITPLKHSAHIASDARSGLIKACDHYSFRSSRGKRRCYEQDRAKKVLSSGFYHSSTPQSCSPSCVCSASSQRSALSPTNVSPRITLTHDKPKRFAGQFEIFQCYDSKRSRITERSSTWGDKHHANGEFSNIKFSRDPEYLCRDLTSDHVSRHFTTTSVLTMANVMSKQAGSEDCARIRSAEEDSLRIEAHRECAMARLEGVSVGLYRYYQGHLTLEEYVEARMCVCWDSCFCTKLCTRYGDMICPCNSAIVLGDE